MKHVLSVGNLSVVVSDLTMVRATQILQGTQAIPMNVPVSSDVVQKLDLYSDHLISHSYAEGYGLLYACATSMQSGIPIKISEYVEHTGYVKQADNFTLVPGSYLVGDIKTFAMRDDLRDLEEGQHQLYDGAIVYMFKVPDSVDLDSPMYDQDNNTYSCDSGYLGIIRCDYLPVDFWIQHEEWCLLECDENRPMNYSVVTNMLPFTPAVGDDPTEPGFVFFAFGETHLSQLENTALDDLSIAQEQFYDDD